MWILYGIEKYLLEETPDGSYQVGMKRDAVATFDKQDQAEAYVTKAKLSTFKQWAPLQEPEAQFRENSVLSGYHLYTIEAKNQLPHNPTE